MTEEQKIKCEEIINLCNIRDHKDIIEAVISLAKVFNKEITEEEAKEFLYNINDILGVSVIVSSLQIFWGIANYFDKNFDNDNNKENENNE